MAQHGDVYSYTANKIYNSHSKLDNNGEHVTLLEFTHGFCTSPGSSICGGSGILQIVAQLSITAVANFLFQITAISRNYK